MCSAAPLCLFFLLQCQCRCRVALHRFVSFSSFNVNASISSLCLIFFLVIDVRIDIDKANHHVVHIVHHHNSHPRCHHLPVQQSPMTSSFITIIEIIFLFIIFILFIHVLYLSSINLITL